MSAKVECLIKDNKVMVFSKSYCPYCTKAKKVFKLYLGDILKHADYKVMELENEPDCGEMQKCLKTKTGASSVPRVFIGGKCIGGGDETEKFHKNGKLKTMLEDLYK